LTPNLTNYRDHGLRVGLCIESASAHEVKLVKFTLVEMVIQEAPEYLIGNGNRPET
jgi:hypothetical protein